MQTCTLHYFAHKYPGTPLHSAEFRFCFVLLFDSESEFQGALSACPRSRGVTGGIERGTPTVRWARVVDVLQNMQRTSLSRQVSNFVQAGGVLLVLPIGSTSDDLP